jgi:transposase-like protein
MEIMTKTTNIKRQHSAAFKLKVALEVIKGVDTVSQIASRYSVHPTQIKTWKQKVLDEGVALFEKHQGSELKKKDDLIEALYKKIGQREIELDWLKKNLESID